MKANIHPKWYPEARVTCACGTTFTVGATVPSMETEVCANCHPFFTGEQRIVDTAGQVERFMRRLEVGESQRVAERERLDSLRQAEQEARRQRRGLTPLRARRSTKKPAPPAEASEAGEG